jgi:hypothetical protein
MHQDNRNCWFNLIASTSNRLHTDALQVVSGLHTLYYVRIVHEETSHTDSPPVMYQFHMGSRVWNRDTPLHFMICLQCIYVMEYHFKQVGQSVGYRRIDNAVARIRPLSLAVQNTAVFDGHGASGRRLLGRRGGI